jgi:hypothetical protein
MHWRGIDLGPVAFAHLAVVGKGGRNWYIDSKSEIDSYSVRHGFDSGVVCDILAIFSPRVTVGFSCELAHEYLVTGKSPRAMKARVKAADAYRVSGSFGGPKVNAFAAALRGDADAVVVDAWMYRAARETRTTPKSYREVAHKVRQCAAGLGWKPRETQAAIWQGAREYVGYYTEGYAPMTLEHL